MIYLPKNTVILDIRTPVEFCQGHLCGAINIPTPLPAGPGLPPLTNPQLRTLRSTLQSELTNIAHRRVHIAVYCKKGVRAGIAADILRKMGYQSVINLGGILDEPLRYEEKCKCLI